MNSVSWVHTAPARVTAAASLRILRLPEGVKTKTLTNLFLSLNLWGLPKKVKCRLFFVSLLFSLEL